MNVLMLTVSRGSVKCYSYCDGKVFSFIVMTLCDVYVLVRLSIYTHTLSLSRCVSRVIA